MQGRPRRGSIRSWRGAAVEPSADLPTAIAAALHDAPTWGALTAPLRGAPPAPDPPHRHDRRPEPQGRGGSPTWPAPPQASVTSSTASALTSTTTPPPDDQLAPRTAPLVTAGLIDPALCRWGQAEARFAGRRFAAPLVDLDSLAAADAKLASWVSARLRPKLLVATQGKVLEAVADQVGRLVPSVPVIAVEPAGPGRPLADPGRALLSGGGGLGPRALRRRGAERPVDQAFGPPGPDRSDARRHRRVGRRGSVLPRRFGDATARPAPPSPVRRRGPDL